MDIPKKIKVAGMTYNIILSKEEDTQLSTARFKGRADYISQEIWLNESHKEDSIAETFLHEIIHVVGECYGISLTEALVLPLSAALYQVLSDNKLEFYDEEK